eukprot:CAMPEP_0195302366 /NCGR_PEP_ID=MMETSP0707-20130614/30943_1 /TAXON_ID=33640 /ORGANISM="Asterionellopsis glacialis, Strain CCMP134" /LENGTH=544 /DNA_ID=CAMNT_0040365599 /DNA_START=145 /DNA_END=1776 /DNA_ORIENTATION=+
MPVDDAAASIEISLPDGGEEALVAENDNCLEPQNAADMNMGTNISQNDFDEINDDESTNGRKGTISSGRFNLLSTMVGGGSLSLPLAFHKSGNALMGPAFIILVAISAEFCIRLLISSSNMLVARSAPTTNTSRRGSSSMELIMNAAFGEKAHVFTMGLIVFLCYFATVGYAVLLRDMLEPITDAIVPPPKGHSIGPTLPHNATMLSIILLVTPFCTLQTFTALKNAGAASMISVLILGSCVVYRSLQCNLSASHSEDRHTSWTDYLTLFPTSAKELLDALPLYISCFVCHYNVLPITNELRNPSTQRVNWLVRSTVWFAAVFYLIIGFAGSMYGNCTPNGSVQGNVLLDFDEDDPLLFMGRLCLSLTLTAAFPMLVLPARDIMLRFWQEHHSSRREESNDDDRIRQIDDDFQPPEERNIEQLLQEPLLTEENGMENQLNGDAVEATDESDTDHQDSEDTSSPFVARAVAAVSFFWTAAALACMVSSIDVVWDLLGSSLSIILSYLIPCGSFVVIEAQRRVTIDYSESPEGSTWKTRMSLGGAW